MNPSRRLFAANIAAFCLVALMSTGCLRARLLHPPSSTTVTRIQPPDAVPALEGAGGTLKGTGVTLHASFGLATPGTLTGNGVSLRVGQ